MMRDADRQDRANQREIEQELAVKTADYFRMSLRD